MAAPPVEESVEDGVPWSVPEAGSRKVRLPAKLGAGAVEWPESLTEYEAELTEVFRSWFAFQHEWPVLACRQAPTIFLGGFLIFTSCMVLSRFVRPWPGGASIQACLFFICGIFVLYANAWAIDRVSNAFIDATDRANRVLQRRAVPMKIQPVVLRPFSTFNGEQSCDTQLRLFIDFIRLAAALPVSSSSSGGSSDRSSNGSEHRDGAEAASRGRRGGGRGRGGNSSAPPPGLEPGEGGVGGTVLGIPVLNIPTRVVPRLSAAIDDVEWHASEA